MNLKDTVIVITGASTGIGEQIALRLASEGVRLALIARNTQRLEEVKQGALDKGAKQVNIYPYDLQETDGIAKLVSKIHSDFGVIDILINNAGIWQKMMQLDELASETIDPIIATNLSSVVHLTHSVLSILKTRPEAAVLNIVSQSGVTAQAGQSVYTATKYGVRGFTDVLKTDLKGSNVRVAGVYQSGTNTSMFASTGETMPLDKFTNPADLADMITYMLGLPPKIWMHEVRVSY